jgi:hypothetical protein
MKNGNCPSGVMAGVAIPLDMNQPTKTVEINASGHSIILNHRLFTRWVTLGRASMVRHTPNNRRFAEKLEASTAGFQVEICKLNEVDPRVARRRPGKNC